MKIQKSMYGCTYITGNHALAFIIDHSIDFCASLAFFQFFFTQSNSLTTLTLTKRQFSLFPSYVFKRLFFSGSLKSELCGKELMTIKKLWTFEDSNGKEKLPVTAFFLFPTMFSPLSEMNNILIRATFFITSHFQMLLTHNQMIKF